MNYEIVEIKQQIVSGLPVLLTTSQTTNSKIITKHWIEFNKVLRSIKIFNGLNWEKFGVTIKKDNNYYYIPSVPDLGHTVLERFILNKGFYAKFQHVGGMNNLKKTIYNIYKISIPNSDLKIDANRSFMHYERYDFRFNWNNSNSIIDIYIPIIM